MKLNQALLVLFLTIVIGGCFAASIHQQKNFRVSFGDGPTWGLKVRFSNDGFTSTSLENSILLPASFNVQTTGAYEPSIFTNSTRLQIYDYISQNPGIQFRGICSGLCIPVGLAQYHLGVLVKAGLISFVRDGKYKRFFVTKQFSKRQISIISLLRHRTTKRIVEVLLNKKQLSHCKLADEVSITSQALTWQMKTLKNTDFVIQYNYGLKTIYAIDESSENLIKTYLAIVN